ncbi:HlyD family efflux transporter periplasmic adaptor subunit [Parvibaculum sp.]|jgi:HlyD family secretion protein|uniref:HlyD family secretion protein n=1 Tax=Parvibaculum sp. TaxID=2024848 RepID=UPI001B1B0304|nr:HlyD family efflux transporter periplasmic adaptor subunit [Parvibaculum sp.]MBO6635020.1 HlyD family efflux transporter periplasmic adaptor subunit [Parvibaculum sp.]MBO6677173.1 HlyD family efflux transporter periplasmic adaptor subunit [Parvibaculum sp.]MBO6685166.1 HlyD family efflux transporter periplasmic adaptor subunit [Parvibaculum sp.]MBO6904730.1 HlyD family efflux transporter periplasmic adaptor subunit [Parvibaculum sp.]
MPSWFERLTDGRKGLLTVFAIIGIFAAGLYSWFAILSPGSPEGIAMSNGRIEAEQVHVATKYAGRVDEIRVDEGDFVTAGQVLAWMDDAQVKAEVAAATADIRRAEQKLAQARALIVQRDAELELARNEFSRAERLSKQGHIPAELLDQRRAQLRTAQAAVTTAEASKAEAEAAIESAKANLARLQDMLDDTVLKAPRSGRVQYRLAEPGEVLAAGGRVLTLLDLSDVYMTIFLPAAEAGRLALGDEARLVLDPIPDYVIPARVSFVAADAQFTPKAVETREERENLMFRIKLSVDPDLLARVEARVKTGVRGVGYVRTLAGTEWPETLAVSLPPIAQPREAADGTGE